MTIIDLKQILDNQMETYEVSRPSVDNWIAFKFPSMVGRDEPTPRQASYFFASHFGTDEWLFKPCSPKSNAFMEAYDEWINAGCPNTVFFGKAI